MHTYTHTYIDMQLHATILQAITIRHNSLQLRLYLQKPLHVVMCIRAHTYVCMYVQYIHL